MTEKKQYNPFLGFNHLVEYMIGIYSQPWLQALLGLRASDGPPREHPGRDLDHAASVQRCIEELRVKMDTGGPREATMRALLYVGIAESTADERGFEMLRRIRRKHGAQKPLAEFKQDLREQYLMLLLDEGRALEAIPMMLNGHEKEALLLLDYLQEITTARGELSEEGQRRLKKMEQLFASTFPADSGEVHPRKNLSKGGASR